jgi:hypothetical protein
VVADIFPVDLFQILFCLPTLFKKTSYGSRGIDQIANVLRVVYKQDLYQKHQTVDLGGNRPPAVTTANHSIANADLDWSSVVGGFFCSGVR